MCRKPNPTITPQLCSCPPCTISLCAFGLTHTELIAHLLPHPSNHRKPNPIIHRDLKPGNLMLSGGPYQDQMQIVFDTGIVKLVGGGGAVFKPAVLCCAVVGLSRECRSCLDAGIVNLVAAGSPQPASFPAPASPCSS